MKCQDIQNELLTNGAVLPSSDSATLHISQCAQCHRLQLELTQLDSCIRDLPAPSSEARKHKFQKQLYDTNLVIRDVPIRPSTQLNTRPALWHSLSFWVGGIAAVLVLFIGWAMWPVPPVGVPIGKTAPRQELLGKEVKYVVQLAKTDSATERMIVWANWSSDLRQTVAELHNAANADEMATLARMYEKALQEGLVKQAKQLPDHLLALERKQTFDEVLAHIAQNEQAMKRLVSNAAPSSKVNLNRMLDVTYAAQSQLQTLSQGAGVQP